MPGWPLVSSYQLDQLPSRYLRMREVQLHVTVWFCLAGMSSVFYIGKDYYSKDEHALTSKDVAIV